MRKSPIRKVSKNPLKKLKDKADRQLQDAMRIKYAGHPCENCGKPFEVSHHFIEKSQSSFLRYDEKNLILICHACHFLIHRGSGRALFDLKIREKRGKEWSDYIIKGAKEYLFLGVKYLEGIIKKYEA